MTELTQQEIEESRERQAERNAQFAPYKALANYWTQAFEEMLKMDGLTLNAVLQHMLDLCVRGTSSLPGPQDDLTGDFRDALADLLEDGE